MRLALDQHIKWFEFPNQICFMTFLWKTFQFFRKKWKEARSVATTIIVLESVRSFTGLFFLPFSAVCRSGNKVIHQLTGCLAATAAFGYILLYGERTFGSKNEFPQFSIETLFIMFTCSTGYPLISFSLYQFCCYQQFLRCIKLFTDLFIISNSL